MYRAVRMGLLAMSATAFTWLIAAYIVLPTAWRHFEHQPGLEPKPMITTTVQGIPGDPINIGLVGSRTDVLRAFAHAGWHPADPITLKTSIEIGISVLLARPYQDAPVSALLYEGRPQDLAFEKPAGPSARQRHHARLWFVLDAGVEGRPVWLGCVSFDESVGFSHDTGQVTHHIASDLDAERDRLMQELSAAGVLTRRYWISGRGPTLRGRNGGGDRYFTDGEVLVGVTAAGQERADRPIDTQPAPLPAAARRKIWALLTGMIQF